MYPLNHTCYFSSKYYILTGSNFSSYLNKMFKIPDLYGQGRNNSSLAVALAKARIQLRYFLLQSLNFPLQFMHFILILLKLSFLFFQLVRSEEHTSELQSRENL